MTEGSPSIPGAAAGMEEILRAAAAPRGGMDFAEFTRLALYAPQVGYYTRPATRVGRTPGADFYTARSLGPVFAELLAAAAVHLLGEARAARATFWEIGAEPDQPPPDALARAFAGYRQVRLGEPLAPTGDAVVFLHEVLDAQPFRRLSWSEGEWRELGVAPGHPGWREIVLPRLSGEAQALLPELPAEAPEGYRLDWPVGAERLLADLLRQPWTGLLLVFDYGTSQAAWLRDFPEGTARAYRAHRQSPDLLAEPGARDLTCHLVWDRLAEIAGAAGLGSVAVERQEAFLLRHGQTALTALLARPDPATRRTLTEILHPAYFGTRFQVLHGIRSRDGDLPRGGNGTSSPP